jgi:sugar diacid utilization regulator
MLGADRAPCTGNTHRRKRPESVKPPQFMPGQSTPDDPLAEVLTRLTQVGLAARLASTVAEEETQLASSVRRAVLTEVPAYSASGNPQILPDLERHAREHVQEVSRLLRGGALAELAFVRGYAQRCAEQRFPLEATLQAHRCVRRVISAWLQERAAQIAPGFEAATSTLADFVSEYTNLASTVAAAEYVARTRSLAASESDSRAELLDTLLKGFDESDARVARLLKRAGYLEQRQAYCVVLAQSTDPVEMENPARAQRVTAALQEALAAANVRMLSGVRNALAIAVVSSTRRVSGWTAPQSNLAERLRERLLALGPAVLIGVSQDHPSTSFVPRAYQEAATALGCAQVSERVVMFAALPVRRLLLHRGGDYLRSVLPTWVPALVEADVKARGTLLQTLRSYADADMNVQKAAAQLAVHPNTMYARLERIREVTGLDAQRYHDLTELLLGCECRLR